MIIEWLVGFAVTVGNFIFGMFPAEDVQPTLGGLATAVGTIITYTQGVGIWFPWQVIVGGITFTFLSWSLLFAFKIVRQLLAHIPFVGGTG